VVFGDRLMASITVYAVATECSRQQGWQGVNPSDYRLCTIMLLLASTRDSWHVFEDMPAWASEPVTCHRLSG
jgi:hypothetical protein